MAVKVDVEIPEGSTIVFELLLEAEVDLSKEPLHMILLHEHFVFVSRNLGYLEGRRTLVRRTCQPFFVDRLVVFEALDIVCVVIILEVVGVTFVLLLLLSRAFLEAQDCSRARASGFVVGQHRAYLRCGSTESRERCIVHTDIILMTWHRQSVSHNV